MPREAGLDMATAINARSGEEEMSTRDGKWENFCGGISESDNHVPSHGKGESAQTGM
jgi:hypothetical protein